MKLTGKSLKDFEKWYLDPIQKKTYKTISNLGGDKAIMLNWFSLSDSHRYGVLVDWFDSVGIYIEICKNSREVIGWYFYINDDQSVGDEWITTRPQAREKAIEKANLLYNNR